MTDRWYIISKRGVLAGGYDEEVIDHELDRAADQVGDNIWAEELPAPEAAARAI